MANYDRNKHLQVLRDSYKTELDQVFAPEFHDLRRKIIKINRLTGRADDYTQSKYYFKQKVQPFVKVPVTYYFGDDLSSIRECLFNLDEFVLKPNHLSQGIGIRVLQRNNKAFEDINGDILTIDDIIEECHVLLTVKRFEADRKIIIEERIQSPPALKVYRNALADIRMIFYKNEFMWCVARMPTDQSEGYGSRCRGAEVGYILRDGMFVKDDPRFKDGLVREGKLPYFEKLVTTGQAVSQNFGIVFQSVDMTINMSEEVVVIESEYLPMLENTFTLAGIKWLDSVVSRDFKLTKLQYKTMYAVRIMRNCLQRIIHRYPKDC